MPIQFTINRNEDVFEQLIKRKVAKKVSFLKNKKKITKQNFMKNQIVIFSEMYGIKTHKIEMFFKDEMKRQFQH